MGPWEPGERLPDGEVGDEIVKGVWAAGPAEESAIRVAVAWVDGYGYVIGVQLDRGRVLMTERRALQVADALRDACRELRRAPNPPDIHRA